MKVDNTNYSNRTLKEMQDKLDQCLEFEEKWGSTTKTRAYIKWCTNEKYRKRVQEFNQSAVNIMKSMGPYKLNKIINTKI